MNIEKVNFVVHFDVLIEHDITSLRTDWLSEEQIDDVLNTTQLGMVVKRTEDEDGDIYFAGDVDLTDQESYINLLKGMPTLSVISAGFDGKFVEPIQNDWPSIRAWMTELRRRTMPAEGRWGSYTEAPVTISLSYMELSQTGFEATYFDLCSLDAIGEFISEMQDSASNNPAVKDFIEYFAPEIQRFRDGEISKFLEYWFATELLLTQKELKVVQVGEKFKSLVPIYSAETFEWVRPQKINLFLEGERAWTPEKVFWFTPVPGNRFSEGSDPAWDYSLVSNLEQRVGLSDTSFSKMRFAVTMNALRTFVEDYDVTEAFYEVADFYQKYCVEIQELTELMRSSFEWDDLISLDGEEAEFIEDLEFPKNALNIWEEYLEVILRSDPDKPKSPAQNTPPIAVPTAADYIASITNPNTADAEVANKALDYCKTVLIPAGRHAEAFCVAQVINRYYFSKLVPSAAFDTANASRSNLEGEGYTILEPSTFEIRPKGDNPWNYSRTKQTIVEVNIWSTIRNSSLSEDIANIPRPINLATEFEIIYGVLSGIESSTSTQTLDFFRSGLEGQGDVAAIFVTARWLTGYYIHKMIWSAN